MFKFYVEFIYVMRSSKDLQFSFKVFSWAAWRKDDASIVKTRKDAQQQAVENALRSLHDKYVSYITSHSRAGKKDSDKQSSEPEESLGKDGLPVERTSEAAEARHSYNKENQQVHMQANSPRERIIPFIVAYASYFQF